MSGLNDVALDALKANGYLRGTKQADRARLARDTGRIYLGNLVEGDAEAEVQEKGISSAELRAQLVGTVPDDEAAAQLDGLFSEITRAEGPVQEWLNSKTEPQLDDEDGDDEDGDRNGDGPAKRRVYLCSARAKRTLVDGAGQPVKTISVNVRFASDNPVQVERYAAQPEITGIERKAATVRRRINTMTDVVPQLETRKQAWLNDINRRVQGELPPAPEQVA